MIGFGALVSPGLAGCSDVVEISGVGTSGVGVVSTATGPEVLVVGIDSVMVDGVDDVLTSGAGVTVGSDVVSKAAGVGVGISLVT